MPTFQTLAARLAPALGLAIVLGLPPLLAQTIVQEWGFNETAGTPLINTAATQPPGSSWTVDALSEPLGASATDGLGNLVVGGPDYTTAQTAIAPLDSGSGFSTGTLTLEVAISGWDYGPTERPRYFVSVLNSAGNIVAGIIFDIGRTSAFVGGISDTGVDTPSANDLVLPRSLTTPNVFRLIIDFATGSYTLQASQNGGAFVVVGVNTIAAPGTTPDLAVKNVEIYARYPSVGTKTNVDRITVTHLPSTPARTPIENWRLQYFESAANEGPAADDADPDFDGIPNLIEYATGTNPTTVSPAPAVLGRDGTGRLTLSFTSIADASLTYQVLASGDLATWTPISTDTGAALGAGPQTKTDTQVATATPRRFLRLSVGPTTPPAP